MAPNYPEVWWSQTHGGCRHQKRGTLSFEKGPMMELFHAMTANDTERRLENIVATKENDSAWPKAKKHGAPPKASGERVFSPRRQVS